LLQPNWMRIFAHGDLDFDRLSETGLQERRPELETKFHHRNIRLHRCLVPNPLLPQTSPADQLPAEPVRDDIAVSQLRLEQPQSGIRQSTDSSAFYRSLKQRSHAGIRAQFFVHSAASSRIPFGRSFSESDWILFPHAGAKSLFLHCAGTKRLEWLIFSENLLPHPENRKPLHRTA